MEEFCVGLTIAIVWLILCGLPISYDVGRRRGRKDSEDRAERVAQLMAEYHGVAHQAVAERNQMAEVARREAAKCHLAERKYRQLRQMVMDGETWKLED